MPKKHIESFNPRMIALVQKAATEKVEIKFHGFKRAAAFRLEFYSLKRVLRDKNHPLWSLASRLQLKVKEEKSEQGSCFWVEITPTAEDFDEELTKAGIKTPEIEASEESGIPDFDDI